MPTIKEYIDASDANYTYGRQGREIDHILVHFTSTMASARNNCIYFSRPGAFASAHYFVDRDGSIYQSVSMANTAWHAGNWDMNLRSIGIECVSDGADFTEEQICALAELVRWLMEGLGVPAENVIRHYDVTGKLCPLPYIDNGKWAALHARITAEPEPAPAPAPEPVIYQPQTEPMNSNGLWYQVHVADLGWLEPVHDGMQAGTTGQSRRMEAVRMNPPEGTVLRVKAHLQDVGWIDYGTIEHVDSIENAKIIGTVGEWRRLEAVQLEIAKDGGCWKKLKYQLHLADDGWTGWVEAPYTDGTVGIGRRTEAARFVLEK